MLADLALLVSIVIGLVALVEKAAPFIETVMALVRNRSRVPRTCSRVEQFFLGWELLGAKGALWASCCLAMACVAALGVAATTSLLGVAWPPDSIAYYARLFAWALAVMILSKPWSARVMKELRAT